MLEDITIFFGAPGLLASYAIGPALEFAHILVGYGADEFIILIMYDTLELGDKTVDFPPNFSLYEFAALQACENNHWSLAMIYSEVELVKGASIVDAYVVHKSVEEHTVAQQIQLAELGKASGAAMRTSLLASTRALLVIILEQKHHYLFLLCETPMEVNKKCRLRDPESFFYLQQSYCYK
uniref:Myosin head, motor region n=1 Tax=Solanum tuberosum TaxID=4113 RepID=M1ATL7_SOLTU